MKNSFSSSSLLANRTCPMRKAEHPPKLSINSIENPVHEGKNFDRIKSDLMFLHLGSDKKLGETNNEQDDAEESFNLLDSPFIMDIEEEKGQNAIFFKRGTTTGSLVKII